MELHLVHYQQLFAQTAFTASGCGAPPCAGQGPPLLTDHRCSDKCVLVAGAVDSATRDLYVCQSSLNLHRCGDFCTERVRTVEGTYCRLTRLFYHDAIVHETRVRVDPVSLKTVGGELLSDAAMPVITIADGPEPVRKKRKVYHPSGNELAVVTTKPTEPSREEWNELETQFIETIRTVLNLNVKQTKLPTSDEVVLYLLRVCCVLWTRVAKGRLALDTKTRERCRYTPASHAVLVLCYHRDGLDYRDVTDAKEKSVRVLTRSLYLSTRVPPRRTIASFSDSCQRTHRRRQTHGLLSADNSPTLQMSPFKTVQREFKASLAALTPSDIVEIRREIAPIPLVIEIESSLT